MKKIVLSLLALAATMNIMAVTYSAKATITLESQDSYESCQMIIGQSDELQAGLTSGEYAEINMDGRSVALYVEYKGVKYQHFASNPATMVNLAVGAMTDAASNYNLIISDVTGAFTLKIGDAAPVVVTAGTTVITLPANEAEIMIGFINYAPLQVNLNSEGLATFSAAEKTLVPAGLKAYKAGNFDVENGYLTLEQVAAEDDILPANTGVLLFGEPSANPYTMAIVNDGTPVDVTGNKFHASSEWAASLENVYILHGNELWSYTGTEFKPNKAYLQIEMPSGNSLAPRRISLRYDAATDVENVDASIKAEKFIQNGQVLIRRGEVIYNLQGQVVK